MNIRQPRWMYGNAALGTAVWLALLAVCGHGEVGLGSIERLFLLAPLVLVPLALELAGKTDSSNLYRATCVLQPFAAILVAFSFMMPQGGAAALLATPWMLVTVLAGLCGLIRLARNKPFDTVEACFCAGLVMLPIGGIGLIQSRFGATPLGFHEPWVLLVAVHFHYAAFIAPVLVGAIGRALENRIGSNNETRISRSGTIRRALFRTAAAAVIAGSPLMASGFVLDSPWLRAVAAFVLALGLVIQSIEVFAVLPTIRPRLAQAMLTVSAASIIVAMGYAILFTLGDARGEVWISIPRMARTHVILNAFGFSLCGLLGWSLAAEETAQVNRTVAQRRPQTLLGRWA